MRSPLSLLGIITSRPVNSKKKKEVKKNRKQIAEARFLICVFVLTANVLVNLVMMILYGNILFTSTAVDDQVEPYLKYYPHFENLTYLDLWDWENRSIYKGYYQNADRPDVVPETCGLGTVSNGGGLFHLVGCGGGQSAYERVRHETKEWIKEDGTCDLCRIVEYGRRHGTVVSFWGDSVQHQVFEALHCELLRRGYVVEHELVHLKIAECTGMLCPKAHFTLSVRSPRWENVTIINENKTTTKVTTTLPDPVKFHFFLQYRVRNTVKEVYETSLRYIMEVGTNVLVWNFGLHWRWNMIYKFRNTIRIIVETIQTHFSSTKSSSQRNILLYRETSAQHFGAPFGEYGMPRENGVCVPLQPNRDLSKPEFDVTFGWRDDIVQAAASQAGYRVVDIDPSASGSVQPKRHLDNDDDDSVMEMIVLPFRNFSAMFSDLHPDECTHYCYTPFLYYPMWRSLRLSMDREYGNI